MSTLACTGAEGRQAPATGNAADQQYSVANATGVASGSSGQNAEGLTNRAPSTAQVFPSTVRNHYYAAEAKRYSSLLSSKPQVLKLHHEAML